MARVPHRGWLALCGLLAAACPLGCGSSGSTSGSTPSGPWAHVAVNRSQLIGGDRALGEVGDTIMENEKIRVVIQKEGYSRGFGVYGGSLIDADLRRPTETGNSGVPVGNDQFSELFPAFFVQAVNVDKVEILDDGSNSGTARVEASGVAGDFLELVAFLNRAITGSNQDPANPDSTPHIRYSTTYELAPNAQYVAITFRVQNIFNQPLLFPGTKAKQLAPLLGLNLNGFTVPLGDIALFGATSNVFIPGVGFDLRFGLERAYQRPIAFPAFPGIVTEFVASQSDGASYGLLAADDPNNYVLDKQDVYADDRSPPITQSSMLIPFVASSFVGIFYSKAPDMLAPGDSFEVKKYFIVGSGDVGSVVDVINQIQGTKVGRLGGQVIDAVTGQPGTGLSVVVYQHLDRGKCSEGSPRPYSQYTVREDGSFTGTLAPGLYCLKVVGKGRPGTDFVDFEIREGETTSLRVGSTPPGRIFVRILDEAGDAIPAKSTAVGYYDAKYVGQLTPSFLFDLSAGEDFRSTDLVTDDPNDEKTRSYIESIAFTANGIAELSVRPGTYDVVSSRGPEYDTATSTGVTVGPAQTVTLEHVLHRVMDTTGWMALDPHIHSRASIDSPMSLDDRVVAIAAEGVEIPVASDHNYITDYGPYVARNNLTRWLHPMVGLELTTLESGHFNGYPLRYEVGPITHGSFEWANRTPDQIFDDLRALGRNGPDQTIVQVNHPRDFILGYYTQYNRDGLTAQQRPPTLVDQFTSPTGPAFLDAKGNTTFSFKYDTVELLNAKLFREIHHYRVPDPLPPAPLPPTIPPTGTILQESTGAVAFPGVVDDWFNLLNLGYRFIGVGSGDSHSGFDEPGQFRTMIHLGVDTADSVTDQMVVDALRSRRVVATNGPLIDFWINDPTQGVMGQTIEDDDGKVQLSYKLTAGPWMGVNRINIYRNGVIAYSREVDPTRDLAADPLEETLDLDLAQNAAGLAIDSWFVIEAIGYQNMYPEIRTLEIPPVLLTDALGSLAGPLGLAGDEFDNLMPPMVFPVTPYAITNPVWVTTHPGDFVPPGVVPLDVQNRPENDPKFPVQFFEDIVSPRAPAATPMLQSQLGRMNVPGHRNVPLFYPLAGDFTDVRKVLGRLGALGHHGEH